MSVQINSKTGQWEYVPDSSLTIQNPLGQTGDYSPATQSSSGNSTLGSKLFNSDWWFTPLGGANTKSPGEIGLSAFSSLADLAGNLYSTNKQMSLLKDQMRFNENTARANFANAMSDAAYNRGNYVNMVNGWGNQEFTNQTAQNALDSYNSLAQAGSNIGLSTNTLDAQKQRVQAMMG